MAAVSDTELDPMTDPDLEAFLHIVHISDMHCKVAGQPVDIAAENKVRTWAAALRLVGCDSWAHSLEQRWESGLAGHDPRAHDSMCEFLDYFARHSLFAGVETWLVDTGDLTALGDMESLQTALGWVDQYAKLLDASNTLVLHGNHDAWPGRFPLHASAAEIQAQQQALRDMIKTAWPHTAISTAIPHSDARVRLSALNSTTGDRIANTLARGIVDTDPPWPCPGATSQLDSLAAVTQQQFDDKGTRDFRILAVHHPVHYPPQRPAMQMSMKNDSEVAEALAQFGEHRRGPLAHLILSGHTHETYPAHGYLPPTSTSRQYKPLYEGQIQLVAGSLSQLPRFSTRQKLAAKSGDGRITHIPQQCEILTFFASPRGARQGQLTMERRIVGRSGRGAFKVLNIPHKPDIFSESLVWQY